MMKMVRRSTDNPTLTEYVKEKLPKGSKIAFDFNLFSKGKLSNNSPRKL